MSFVSPVTNDILSIFFFAYVNRNAIYFHRPHIQSAIFISTIRILLNLQWLRMLPILFETDTLVYGEEKNIMNRSQYVAISLFMKSVNLNLTFIKLFKNKIQPHKFLIITFSRVPHPAFCCSFYTTKKKA